MTFSLDTKNELSKLELNDKCCQLVELAALVRMNGTISISSNSINLKFTTENASLARRIFSIIKTFYKTEVEVMVRRNRQLKKNNNYLILINQTDISKRILEDVGFIKGNEAMSQHYKIPEGLIENRCCKRSYIRGAFLGGGSISNPEKAYHLEFVTNNIEFAENLSLIINSFDLKSKVISRKENFLVYLKEAEQISDLLNIIGAHQALLKFEDIRVLKDVRNNINRIVNCETANLTKTIDASIRQIEQIEIINNKMGLNKLPDNLRTVAEIRINNPDATLKEIGEMLNPPIGKSGVNHRFRKIEDIAKELQGVK